MRLMGVSMSERFPLLATEWDSTKNEGSLDGLTPRSEERVWWRCSTDHEWETVLGTRVLGWGEGEVRVRPCPICEPYQGGGKHWTPEHLRAFVQGLLPRLVTMGPAEREILFEQGFPSRVGPLRRLGKALLEGAVQEEDLQRFCRGEEDTSLDDVIQQAAQEDVEDTEATLPEPRTHEVLVSVDGLQGFSDEEAAQMLLELRKEHLWVHAYRDAKTAVAEAESFEGDEYANRVRDSFLTEYRGAQDLEIPRDYHFTVDRVPTPPNLMQRRVAYLLTQRGSLGNWSDTGAGKTNSALLAARVLGVRVVLVVCPNNVVDTWVRAIPAMFQDVDIQAKTFEPQWRRGSQHRYLVLNYEMFQRGVSLDLAVGLVQNLVPGLIVLDEIQLMKRRDRATSRRRGVLLRTLAQAREVEPEVKVLGMSATPVINELREGQSVLEAITGLAYQGSTASTVHNCLVQHRAFVQTGVRWVPDYEAQCEELVVEAPCDDLVPEILDLPSRATILDLEQILTRARLPIILDNLQPKTLVYTYNVTGVVEHLHEAILEAGWRVGFYTGGDKTGLQGFLHGSVDILIASQAVTLGIDGLQHISNRVILNVLPWTFAEYKQLKGRIYRQGQYQKTTVVIPTTFAEIDGRKWSWDEAKLRRLRFKRSLGDAVVDGTIPHGQLRTPQQAFRDALAWLKRLEESKAA